MFGGVELHSTAIFAFFNKKLECMKGTHIHNIWSDCLPQSHRDEQSRRQPLNQLSHDTLSLHTIIMASSLIVVFSYCVRDCYCVVQWLRSPSSVSTILEREVIFRTWRKPLCVSVWQICRIPSQLGHSECYVWPAGAMGRENEGLLDEGRERKKRLTGQTDSEKDSDI